MPRATTTQHTRTTGKQLTYDISADYHGTYTVSRDGRVLRHGQGMGGEYFGRPRTGPARFGTRAQLDQAIAFAKDDIEQLRGMEEE